MKCERIDCFWNQIFLLNDQVSRKKYPNLEKIVRMSLVLSCGNADVEREFSKSKGILSEDKTLIDERSEYSTGEKKQFLYGLLLSTAVT